MIGDKYANMPYKQWRHKLILSDIYFITFQADLIFLRVFSYLIVCDQQASQDAKYDGYILDIVWVEKMGKWKVGKNKRDHKNK